MRKKTEMWWTWWYFKEVSLCDGSTSHPKASQYGPCLSMTICFAFGHGWNGWITSLFRHLAVCSIHSCAFRALAENKFSFNVPVAWTLHSKRNHSDVCTTDCNISSSSCQINKTKPQSQHRVCVQFLSTVREPQHNSKQKLLPWSAPQDRLPRSTSKKVSMGIYKVTCFTLSPKYSYPICKHFPVPYNPAEPRVWRAC